MNAIIKMINLLNKPFVIIAGTTLLVMILLTCANVFFRLFGSQIFGTYELMGFLGAITGGAALGHTKIRGAHIAVDILVIKMYNPGIRKYLSALNAVIILAFFLTVTWQTIKYGIVLKRTGDVTDTLHIIYYPFVWALAAGFGFLSFSYLEDIIRAFPSKKET